MMPRSPAAPQALILGGGVFGLTAALELRRRGWRVTLKDQGPIPHPDAASTDISKVCRMDYGADLQYTEMGEQSLQGWRRWNEEWGENVFHEDGFLVMSSHAMKDGSFEYESFELLRKRGHMLRRTDSALLRRLHPAWNAERFMDGYLNPEGGWVESGKVISRLKQEAGRAGVKFQEGSRVETMDLQERRADVTVAALGAWTPAYLPWLQAVMWATAQTVFHFRPGHAADFRAPAFPVWAADIGVTGWYGFPATADGLVKVANHGAGRRVDARETRQLPEGEEARYRKFLADAFPSLASAPLASTRVCLYCDTFDGHFWIARDPERPWLAVAAGDSGHAFKFAPVLGPLIADAVERKPNPWLGRFAWRAPAVSGREGARAS